MRKKTNRERVVRTEKGGRQEGIEKSNLSPRKKKTKSIPEGYYSETCLGLRTVTVRRLGVLRDLSQGRSGQEGSKNP